MTRRKSRRIRISKTELRSFILKNMSTEEIARRCMVSSRTITRRIKDYGLRGLRPKGRKPKVKRS